MAKEYDNEMRGVLFRNDRKTSDKHPDYNGSCQVKGVNYWVSGWIKESREGKKFMSLALKPKEDDGVDQRPASERQPKTRDDDIPFAWLLPFIALTATAGGAFWLA